MREEPLTGAGSDKAYKEVSQYLDASRRSWSLHYSIRAFGEEGGRAREVERKREDGVCGNRRLPDALLPLLGRTLCEEARRAPSQTS